MMIPDAPWIREAEMLGMPPYNDDDPAYERDCEYQAKEMRKAYKLTDQIVDFLLGVEDALEPYEEKYDEASKTSKEVREMLYKVQDLGCEINSLAEWLNGRG